MKKLGIPVVVFTCLFSVAYAQETKLIATPVNDDIKLEQRMNHALPAMPLDKYPLPDKNDYVPGNEIIYKTDFMEPNTHSITLSKKNDPIKDFKSPRFLFYPGYLRRIKLSY